MFVKIGDKVFELNKDKQITGVTSKTITHPDGRVDCEVHVPCFQLKPEVKEVK